MATVVALDDGLPVGPMGIADRAVRHAALSAEAFVKFETAQTKTRWGRSHLRQFALIDGDRVLASARRYDLTGSIGRQPLVICGIGSVRRATDETDLQHATHLVESLVADAARDGADLALVFRLDDLLSGMRSSFDVIPTTDVELTVAQSARHGAPMMLVRAGEDRDLDAIAAMGEVRAATAAFHLDRDVDFLKHAITRTRLLAGLGAAGAREARFVIAEEGITAAAYALISVVKGTWTIEECGDRDPAGARVGAILQALIAREPGETRPVIRGWLPPGFVPPQVTIASATPSTDLLGARVLSSRVPRWPLSADDVLYWRSDLL